VEWLAGLARSYVSCQPPGIQICPIPPSTLISPYRSKRQKPDLKIAFWGGPIVSSRSAGSSNCR